MTTFRDASLKAFFKPGKIPWGIYPLVGMMTFALSGMTYFIAHTAGGPELAWTKQERKPFYEGYANNNLERDSTTKIYSPNGRFSGRWNKLTY